VRIVAGRLRGRTLAGPSGPGTRPTSDRVRGAIFNILVHAVDGFAIDGTRVLDLFAGTGAMGIEALSRGAAFCEFVERSSKARALIRGNIDALDLSQSTRITSLDAASLPRAGRTEPFDLVFLDPPYAQGLAERALAGASAGGWLAQDAIIVVEERADVAVRWPDGFSVLDQRRWGDTQAVFARYRARH
jgi:16S rRNA (guanine966-N2)-methyltransferase